MYTVKMFNEQTIWMESTSMLGIKERKLLNMDLLSSTINGI